MVNGTEATVVKVVTDDNEPILPQLLQTRPKGARPLIRQLRYLPTYVVVRFKHVTLPAPMPGLTSRKEAIIGPDIRSFQFPIRGKNQVFTVYRKQLPLTPTRAMTVNMGQGRTMEPLVADANLNEAGGHKHTKLYVMLSRCRTLSGLWLLRHFHHREIHRSPDTIITKEMLRLQKLQAITIARFKRDHPDGFVFAAPIQHNGHDPATLIHDDPSDVPEFPPDYAERVRADRFTTDQPTETSVEDRDGVFLHLGEPEFQPAYTDIVHSLFHTQSNDKPEFPPNYQAIVDADRLLEHQEFEDETVFVSTNASDQPDFPPKHDATALLDRQLVRCLQYQPMPPQLPLGFRKWPTASWCPARFRLSESTASKSATTCS